MKKINFILFPLCLAILFLFSNCYAIENKTFDFSNPLFSPSKTIISDSYIISYEKILDRISFITKKSKKNILFLNLADSYPKNQKLIKAIKLKYIISDNASTEKNVFFDFKNNFLVVLIANNNDIASLKLYKLNNNKLELINENIIDTKDKIINSLVLYKNKINLLFFDKKNKKNFLSVFLINSTSKLKFPLKINKRNLKVSIIADTLLYFFTPGDSYVIKLYDSKYDTIIYPLNIISYYDENNYCLLKNNVISIFYNNEKFSLAYPKKILSIALKENILYVLNDGSLDIFTLKRNTNFNLKHKYNTESISTLKNYLASDFQDKFIIYHSENDTLLITYSKTSTNISVYKINNIIKKDELLSNNLFLNLIKFFENENSYLDSNGNLYMLENIFKNSAIKDNVVKSTHIIVQSPEQGIKKIIPFNFYNIFYDLKIIYADTGQIILSGNALEYDKFYPVVIFLNHQGEILNLSTLPFYEDKLNLNFKIKKSNDKFIVLTDDFITVYDDNFNLISIIEEKGITDAKMLNNNILIAYCGLLKYFKIIKIENNVFLNNLTKKSDITKLKLNTDKSINEKSLFYINKKNNSLYKHNLSDNSKTKFFNYNNITGFDIKNNRIIFVRQITEKYKTIYIAEPPDYYPEILLEYQHQIQHPCLNTLLDKVFFIGKWNNNNALLYIDLSNKPYTAYPLIKQINNCENIESGNDTSIFYSIKEKENHTLFRTYINFDTVLKTSTKKIFSSIEPINIYNINDSFIIKTNNNYFLLNSDTDLQNLNIKNNFFDNIEFFIENNQDTIIYGKMKFSNNKNLFNISSQQIPKGNLMLNLQENDINKDDQIFINVEGNTQVYSVSSKNPKILITNIKEFEKQVHFFSQKKINANRVVNFKKNQVVFLDNIQIEKNDNYFLDKAFEYIKNNQITYAISFLQYSVKLIPDEEQRRFASSILLRLLKENNLLEKKYIVNSLSDFTISNEFLSDILFKSNLNLEIDLIKNILKQNNSSSLLNQIYEN